MLAHSPPETLRPIKPCMPMAHASSHASSHACPWHTCMPMAHLAPHQAMHAHGTHACPWHTLRPIKPCMPMAHARTAVRPHLAQPRAAGRAVLSLHHHSALLRAEVAHALHVAFAYERPELGVRHFLQGRAHSGVLPQLQAFCGEAPASSAAPQPNHAERRACMQDGGAHAERRAYAFKMEGPTTRTGPSAAGAARTPNHPGLQVSWQRACQLHMRCYLTFLQAMIRRKVQ